MKTVETLANSKQDMKQGNHRVEHSAARMRCGRDFYYYDTIICATNDLQKQFMIDDSYGSRSTTRACNAYRKHFLDAGYTEVTE